MESLFTMVSMSNIQMNSFVHSRSAMFRLFATPKFCFNMISFMSFLKLSNSWTVWSVDPLSTTIISLSYSHVASIKEDRHGWMSFSEFQVSNMIESVCPIYMWKSFLLNAVSAILKSVQELNFLMWLMMKDGRRKNCTLFQNNILSISLLERFG